MSATVSDIVASATATVIDPDAATPDDECTNPDNSDTHLNLRIASVFIILISSSFGAFFPVIAYRSKLRQIIPKEVFDFAKYFGSGVIIATAFIHLLDPAIEELGSSCLTGTWQTYPWALALCMFSIFCIFFLELFAFRWGTAKLKKLGITYDAHGHGVGGSHVAHGPESDHGAQQSHGAIDTDAISSGSREGLEKKTRMAGGAERQDDLTGDLEAVEPDLLAPKVITEAALPQIIGIFILEFGILLHSVLIGLTLAVDPNFTVLFVVLVFHQMFEGLGLGARLAYLKLPIKYNYVAYIAAALYGLTTPIGIAAGLGVRTTYNPNSPTASIVSGVMDALSAGVLVYTGLVELLAHEFLFSDEMRKAKDSKLLYACLCMLVGAGCMALLGRWA